MTALRAEGCGIAFGDEYICRLSAAALPEAAKTKQPRLSVSRLKGRPFYGQAMGQLRLTCTFSAECAQRVEMHPYPRLRGTSPKGKHVTGFSGRFAPLRIQFLCHPGGGKFALRTAFVLISISRHNAARTSPSGGGAVGRRGAFPSPARAVGLFPSGEARLYGFLSVTFINSNWHAAEHP